MQRVSYWLMPSEPDRERLAQAIRALAARFEAPVFDPHVTIYSGPLHVSDAVPQIIAEAARAFSPLTLQTTSMAHSEQFTQTLFIELAGNPALARLSGMLKGRMTAPREYELRPHLSLIYATLPAETRGQLAREISVPPTIRCDAIRAIRHRGVSTRGDVEAWETLAEAELHGA